MESFRTHQKLNITILGLGMMVSAHIVKAVELIDCGEKTSDFIGETLFMLDNNMICDGPSPAFTVDTNNNHILLQGNSITAGTPVPASGILITGDGNHVEGGRVEGFDDANINIINGSFNHVSKLHIIGGGDGIEIDADGDSANGNIIYHNRIQVGDDGIDLDAFNGGVANGNLIYDNSTRVGDDGINLDAFTGGVANDNIIYHNRIQARDDGIDLDAFDGGIANRTIIHHNIIQAGDGDEGLRG